MDEPYEKEGCSYLGDGKYIMKFKKSETPYFAIGRNRKYHCTKCRITTDCEECPVCSSSLKVPEQKRGTGSWGS